MAWWQLCLVLLCGAIALVAAASFVYVTFRFLSMALSLDAALLREFKGIRTPQAHQAALTLDDQLKQFINSRMKPTDGDFVPSSEEDLFINEQVNRLREQGDFSEEEIKQFVHELAARGAAAAAEADG